MTPLALASPPAPADLSAGSDSPPIPTALSEWPGILDALRRSGAPPEVFRAIASTPEERLDRVLRVRAWRARHPGQRPPARCSRQLAADAVCAELDADLLRVAMDVERSASAERARYASEADYLATRAAYDRAVAESPILAAAIRWRNP